LSPRTLDTQRYATPYDSIFYEDDGGIREFKIDHDKQGKSVELSTGGRYIYFVGIIDILQQYNSRKIAETFFKGFRHNRKQISAVNPDFYGDRFIQFIEKHVLE